MKNYAALNLTTKLVIGLTCFAVIPFVVLQVEALGYITLTQQQYTVQGIFLAAWIVLGFYVMARSITGSIDSYLLELGKGSHLLRSSVGQVTSSALSLAQGATEQASSLQETAASLEQIASASKQNAENSQAAFELSSQVKDASVRGVTSMNEMTDAISAIKASADETAQIVKTIDEIAFQTNLLALNAAVEAARAGDAGKGFAVVAEEVRNLAQRSAQAAKETSEKLHRSKDLADNGVKVTVEVANFLQEIESNSTKSAQLVKEIAQASKEQSLGITQVNRAVVSLDRVTQQNAASAQQSSAAAAELAVQATGLDTVISSLRAVVRSGEHIATQKKKATTSSQKNVVTSTPSVKKEVVPTTPRSKTITAKPKKEDKSAIIELTPSQIIPLDDNDFAGF